MKFRTNTRCKARKKIYHWQITTGKKNQDGVACVDISAVNNDVNSGANDDSDNLNR